MALFSRIRTTASSVSRMQPQLRYLSSASSILSPDAKTPLTSRDKSRAAISLLKSEKDPSKIVEICRAASLTPEFHLDRIAFSIAIGTLSKEKETSAVTELLDGFIKTRPDLKTERYGSHAIVLYGQANMLDHAVRLFRELEQLGIQRTVKSLNALLLACVLARDYEEAKRIYVEFPKMYGIEPDLETYNRIIKAFCESGSSSSAYSVVAEMDRQGIKPTATTFGIILAGFYSEEKLDDVGKVLNMMKQNGVHVGVSTYNIRIQSLCKMKKSSEAKALLAGMISSGMKPNSMSYCHLVHGFCREGNMDEAKKLFKSMADKGCKPDSDCYFTLLHFLCKDGDYETALSVCKESMEKNWVPNSATMKMLVNGLASISMVDEAKELVGQVKERFSRNVEMWDEIEAGLSQ